ncbi:MAG: CRISPR-associated endonuclease Cas4/Cas1 [Hydrogenophilales bacterium CG12_big_fil_rev_8_21_14_0_65_61_21]|nr:MAG: CRISPR-associated endonuclease Cas4/Cas1 [Hydrogenophilales bacterium CG12_big_fil_rev_8_21_14_0_65_61_21]
MPDQRELSLAFPELDPEAPLIPVRMVNEYVYCPRLAYLMWVQSEWADSADTVEGRVKHKRVDAGNDKLPETPQEDERIHARSVSLASLKLGITAKLDLVEGEGSYVTPVDYKRGKRPHVDKGAYDPERVQICAQGLLLQEHGYECDSGVLYFVDSRERVRVMFDEILIEQTLASIHGLRGVAYAGHIPPPLEDSPKCPRCSLVGICLPDEVRFLNAAPIMPRPLAAKEEYAAPLYVQSPRAWLRKDEERIVVEVEKQKVGDARLREVSQVVVFGSTGMSTPLLHELMRREIPVSYHTYGGWFVGHTVGLGHRNVETRIHQYRASFDEHVCLRLARGWVAAKIANCRTLMRRNWRGEFGDDDEPFETADKAANDQGKPPDELLRALKEDAEHAGRAHALDELLGIEGIAARRYFQHFANLIKKDDDPTLSFDFMGRNRRPPKDPVNAMLSFAYAMLTREWHIALSAVGLDPYRGYYHQPRFGRPALALDMMEPFRPLVADSTVLMAINNGEVRGTDFIHAAGACALSDSGRKRFIAAFERRLGQEVTHPLFGYRLSYRRLFEVQGRLLARHLAGETPDYPNFVTR